MMVWMFGAWLALPQALAMEPEVQPVAEEVEAEEVEPVAEEAEPVAEEVEAEEAEPALSEAHDPAAQAALIAEAVERPIGGGLLPRPDLLVSMGGQGWGWLAEDVDLAGAGEVAVAPPRNELARVRLAGDHTLRRRLVARLGRRVWRGRVEAADAAALLLIPSIRARATDDASAQQILDLVGLDGEGRVVLQVQARVAQTFSSDDPLDEVLGGAMAASPNPPTGSERVRRVELLAAASADQVANMVRRLLRSGDGQGSAFAAELPEPLSAHVPAAQVAAAVAVWAAVLDDRGERLHRREQAAWTLGAIGHPESVRVLARVATDLSVPRALRHAAMLGLGRTGLPEARAAIEAAVDVSGRNRALALRLLES